MAIAPLVCAGAIAAFGNVADETSSGDKLRILYSNRFSFADTGAPLVTVEIMGGQKQISISAEGGLNVLPDGTGGSEILGKERWTISTDQNKPAKTQYWVIVKRISPSDSDLIRSEVARWKQRGFSPKTFDVGTLFGVKGRVLDSRQVLVVVSPSNDKKAVHKSAKKVAAKYRVATEIHHHLLERPKGRIVAKSGDLTVVNPSVLWFAPRNRDKTIGVSDVVTGGGGSQLETTRKDRNFFGYVYITIGRDGRLTAVNAVTADRLLMGLVPSEIFPDSPEDALAAQAVAARTELIEKLGTRHLADPFLLCSSQHCQVYSGAGREHPRTTKAVRRTRGKVLMRTNGGGLVDARYSAACGGHGEHKHIIWGGEKDKSLRGLPDTKGHVTPAQFAKGITDENIGAFLDDGRADFCGKTRFSKNRHRWTVELSPKEMNAFVAAKFPKIGRVTRLVPQKRGVSGRVVSLKIVGDRGQEIINGDLAIRRLFGGLKSSLFEVRLKGTTNRPTSFVFRGAGFGHGVGMCQLGAIGMAKSGFRFSEILKHYYQKSEIQQLY